MKDIEIVVFNDKSWVRFTEYQKLDEELQKEISETENALDMFLEENEHLKRDNGLLAKRICELRSDLSRAKSQIEKMVCCMNCGNQRNMCLPKSKKLCCSNWRLAE